MSKKQPPITEIENYIDSAILLYNDNDHVDKCKKNVVKVTEQYAQAKVLEVLESLKSEVSKGENVYNHSEILKLIEIEIIEAKSKQR